MKNYFLLVSFISVLLLSCGKENIDSTSNSITATIDGKSTPFPNAYFSFRQDAANPSQNTFMIFGGTELNNLNISIQGETEIVPGATFFSNSTTYRVNVNRNLNDGSLKTYGIFDPGTGDVPYYVVTITAASATEISGTISGNFLYDRYNNNSIQLTEASFTAYKN